MKKTFDLSRYPRDAVKAEIDRRACSNSLSEFVKRGWHVTDPGQPYKHGWHMDALAEHLEAVAKEQITRLLINIPPGTSKSTAASVFFPAWLWGPFGAPEKRIIGASYEQGLATRDNRKNRMLVESEWFQERWPIKLTSDQNEKTGFENIYRGFRQSCAVKSMTGKRGDCVIWDDPLSPEKAYSQTERDTANRVFAETLPTRLNNPDRSAIIIIMQRLHEDDVSGYILARDLGYEHLMLPMEYEPERKCSTSIGWSDPRTIEGELLFPDRFSREVVERDKEVMGSFAFAGQMQQRPVPREGGLFKREWFKFLPVEPADMVECRGWDLAATVSDTAAYTAGVRIGKTKDGKIVISDTRRERLSPNGVRSLIKTTAASDGVKCRQSIPQDPGQAAKGQKEQIAQDLLGFDVRFSPETGDKETRALPLAAQAEAGNVYIVEGDWNAAFLDEVTLFPGSKFKDQADAASRAFNELLKMTRASGVSISTIGVGAFS